jgi:hypothetical protein
VKGNLAVIPFDREENSVIKDGDGEEGGDGHTFQITVDVVTNGYVFTRNDADDITQKVFIFNGAGETGPKALIQQIIDDLGLVDKVKLAK